MKQTEWISHRGESLDAPENTLSSFKLAMERDTDGMETDIHLTSDGVLVCIHDSMTGRTGDKNIRIEDSVFSEIERVDVCNKMEAFRGERIPTFRDALRLLRPGRKFFVEIKENDERVVPALRDLLETEGVAHEQIVVISFHKEMIRLSKQCMPDIKALWLTGFPDAETDISKSVSNTIAILRELNADGIDGEAKENVFNAEYIKALKDAGFYVSVWTVDRPEQAEQYIKFGADAITSNCAAKLKALSN